MPATVESERALDVLVGRLDLIGHALYRIAKALERAYPPPQPTGCCTPRYDLQDEP